MGYFGLEHNLDKQTAYNTRVNGRAMAITNDIQFSSCSVRQIVPYAEKNSYTYLGDAILSK